MRLFPRWAELLGIDAEIVGRDIPPRGEPSALRAAVAEIAEDERLRGALVTTHKVDIYRHAHDLFADFDRNARLCREVSCIAKRDGKLVGSAKDPVTAGLSLDAMISPDHWRRTGGHVLCLGAGGAGTAITVNLLGREHPPARVAVTDADPDRLGALRQIAAELDVRSGIACRLVSSPAESDALLEGLPPASLVVNATGLGKDAPGSPISDRARFPGRAVVWELNYRGSLDFIRQARAQAVERSLEVHDGWLYFLHGWTQVIAEVFELELDAATFARLAAAAEPFGPGSTRLA